MGIIPWHLPSLQMKSIFAVTDTADYKSTHTDGELASVHEIACLRLGAAAHI